MISLFISFRPLGRALQRSWRGSKWDGRISHLKLLLYTGINLELWWFFRIVRYVGWIESGWCLSLGGGAWSFVEIGSLVLSRVLISNCTIHFHHLLERSEVASLSWYHICCMILDQQSSSSSSLRRCRWPELATCRWQHAQVIVTYEWNYTWRFSSP